MTLACDICNTNKGNFYDPANPQSNLIDPYVDEPKDHFIFSREVVTPRPDSMRAFETERTLKLTRNELVERRRERLDFLEGLIRAWNLAPQIYKDMLRDDLLQRHMKSDDEFIGICQVRLGRLKESGNIDFRNGFC